MSELTYSESSGAFVDQLLYIDTELATRMRINDKNINKIYQMYFDRLSLLEKSSLIPLTERDKMLLEDKKEELYLELKLFMLKK